MQKMNDNGTIVLIADDGMVLTDKSSFGTTVRLGKEADAENWHEITDAEYEAILKEHESELPEV